MAAVRRAAEVGLTYLVDVGGNGIHGRTGGRVVPSVTLKKEGDGMLRMGVIVKEGSQGRDPWPPGGGLVDISQ